MDRLVIALVLAVVAVAVAWVLERRRNDAPTVIRAGEVPSRIDRAAVGLSGAGVVVFTEASCRSCATVLGELRSELGAIAVEVAEVEFNEAREVHEQHAISTVPTIVVADAQGSVIRGWTGRTDPLDVAAVAREHLS